MGEECAARVDIPIIDMQESPFPYAKLREALEKLGCFRVLNHNVPTSLMSEMKSVVRYLHDLPIELKQRVTCVDPFGKGYVSAGVYESFGVSARSIDTFYSTFDLSPDQKATIEAYYGATGELIDNLIDKIATSLGVPCEDKDMLKDWFWQVRIIKYNYTAESVGASGVGSHTDPGFITVLQDDEVVGGLEVFDYAGSLISVEPSPGNLFIMMGDMAAAWSNGKLNTTKHRVQCYQAKVRVSIGSFFMGPINDPVEAPKELVSPSSPRLYKPIYFKEYADLRASNKADYSNGEALAVYRVESS